MDPIRVLFACNKCGHIDCVDIFLLYRKVQALRRRLLLVNIELSSDRREAIDQLTGTEEECGVELLELLSKGYCGYFNPLDNKPCACSDTGFMLLF